MLEPCSPQHSGPRALTLQMSGTLGRSVGAGVGTEGSSVFLLVDTPPLVDTATGLWPACHAAFKEHLAQSTLGTEKAQVEEAVALGGPPPQASQVPPMLRF